MKKLSKKQKLIVNICFLLVLIGVTLAILFTSNKELNFKNIAEYIKTGNPWYLCAAVACMLAIIVLEGFSLFLIVRKLGFKGKAAKSMAYASIDAYYSAVTPSATGGQAAAAVYMVKDGMTAGSASFTFVFRAVTFTSAYVILTAAAFIIKPSLFLQLDFWPQFFIILGVATQLLLVGFFIALLLCHRTILRIGNGIISLLHKMRIIKKKEKWRTKLIKEIAKYANCVKQIKKHKMLFVNVLLLNLGEHVLRVLISVFVCLAADGSAPFRDIFVLQCFLLVGYSSIPLPGGVGIFEFLYLNIYKLAFSERQFMLSAMMIMRTISYYMCMLVTGTVSLIYHLITVRRKKGEEPPTETTSVQLPEPPSGETTEDIAAEE
ncbi:MAG: flippase-like domain-containing protein [Clostridia bacterium]|jgi:hypothetical protein|nr:flippase-like domain-containing protein [Clostridia bacterium]